MKITSLAVRRKLATLAILIALLTLGFYGLSGLPVDLLPDVTYPMIKVHIWWRGATPEEIDKNIADPVERQMATVDGLDYIESSAIEGMYTLLVNFKYGVDVDVAYQDALAAMARAARQLPVDMDPPIVIKADPSQLPIAQLTISSDRWDLVRLRTWTDEWLQDQMLSVPGVAGTEIVGGLEREIRVHLDPVALEKYSLPLATVIQRLREENIQQFAGRVTVGQREFIARTDGEYRNLDDIRNITIRRTDHGELYLRDIATVEDSHEEVRVITRLNGQPCVKLSVMKQADANTVTVADGVMAMLQQLEPALPPEVKLGILENQADYVRSAVNGVRNTALEAFLLIVLTVFLFLGSWRQVVIIGMVIPLVLILNFGLMKIFGFSLNIFSLGGLVIAIGVLLSNAIVVVENITRWRNERKGSSIEHTVLAATQEVGVPILAATLTFLALLLPFLLVPGLTSLLFRELILVIAGIVTISLLAAISVTPMFSAVLLNQRSSASNKLSRFEKSVVRITESYKHLLIKLLRKPLRVVAVFLALLVMAIVLLPHLQSEFLPKMDDGRIMVKVRMPTGASLEATNRIIQRIEQQLEGDELIASSFSLIGGKVWGLYTYEIANEGEVNIQLTPRAERRVSTSEYIKRLRPVMGKLATSDSKIMVSQMKVKGIRRIGEADIEIEISGQDMNQLFNLSEAISGIMKKLNTITNVYVSVDMTKPEYNVRIDRVKAAALGIQVSTVARSLQSLMSGAIASRFRDGDEYYNIRVVIPESTLTSRSVVENLPFTGAEGRMYRLGDFATVVQAVGPVEIVRRNQVKTVVVRGDAAGTSVGAAMADLRGALRSLPIPPGYNLHFGGQAQMMAEMRQSTILVVLFALFFSFIVLTVQFNALKLPGLILLCIPFALTGLVFSLFLSGLPQGATVLIGLLVVIAALANDGVLLLTFAMDRMKSGDSPLVAITSSASLRLRPILMTTTPLIVGLLPLAFNLEQGGEMLQPMAAGAIGGLVMELMVALLLLPALFILLHRRNISKNK